MSSYNLEVAVVAGVPVVSLHGEVDLANAVSLTPEILEQVPDTAPGVVLDLEPTVYLDSAGIRAFFAVARQLAMREQVLVVAVSGDSPVSHLLKTTGANEVAALCETVDAALDAALSPTRN